MTREQLKKANEIQAEIDELNNAYRAIMAGVWQRNRQKEKPPSDSHLKWMMQRFARMKFFSKKKAAMTIHYEFATPIEFDVDEEFVDMVVAYFDRKITKKQMELEAI